MKSLLVCAAIPGSAGFYRVLACRGMNDACTRATGQAWMTEHTQNGLRLCVQERLVNRCASNSSWVLDPTAQTDMHLGVLAGDGGAEVHARPRLCQPHQALQLPRLRVRSHR